MPTNRQRAYLRHARASRWRSVSKGFQTAGKVALTALRVANAVKTLVNAETKYYDTTATSTAVNTTPAINAITAIPQGDTVSQREGNSVKMSSAQCRFSLRWNGTTEDSKYSQRSRLLIVRDLAPNAHSAPVISDILQYTSNAQQLMQSPLNLTNSKRFQMLKDQIYTQQNDQGGINVDWFYKAAQSTRQTYKMSSKTDPHIKWSGVNGTDYAFGHIYVILIGDLASGTATSTCEYMARVRYLDN